MTKQAKHAMNAFKKTPRFKITYTPFLMDKQKFSFFDLRVTNIKVFALHFHHSYAFACYYMTIDFFGINILIYLTKPDYRR